MESGRRVVLFAGLGVGHLTPTVELAKLFLRRGLAVTIAIPATPSSASPAASVGAAPTVAKLAAANPSISLHLLPPPHYPDPDPSHFVRLLDLLRLSAASLRELLQSLPSVAALVIDVFCAHAVDVAVELRVPAYIYCTASAGALASFLHVQYYFSKQTVKSISDIGKELLHFPGVPPIPASDMPSSYREDRPYEARAEVFARVTEARGVLINTFEWLEPRAVKALREGASVPDRPALPVYCVGPLVAPDGSVEGGQSERHPCLAWLDNQPDRSVVFLCFGSMGAFSMSQLKEIARGLESSGHRFLWVVRSPPDPSEPFGPWSEPDLVELLPDGFLERTQGRGLVVPSWAPQVEVLRHKATGVFVTHCGWNSTLEGVTAGVPLLCWPQYAEQGVNKVFIVEEMKVGVVLEGYDEELVTAEEVEAKVRLLMESEEGERLRERMTVAKEKAADALMDAGPSCLALDEFLKDLAGSN